MTPAQHILVLEHVAFARGIALSMARKFPRTDRGDLVSSAFLGLVEAAKAYRPGTVPFGGFAIGRIRGAVLDHVRADHLVRPKYGCGFLSQPWPVSIDAVFERPAATPSPEELSIAANLAEVAHDRLPGRAKTVLRDRMTGVSPAERARLSGITEARVCQLLHRVRDELAAVAA